VREARTHCARLVPALLLAFALRQIERREVVLEVLDLPCA
jgi:hypothetical protein